DESCNTALVDPPKATKGRRMSKKSRKKSSKSASGARPAKKTRTQTKAKPAATRRAPTRKSTTATKKTAETTLHKAASKQLRLSKSASTSGKATLAEGDKAPAFNLPRDGGGLAKLSDYAGEKLVLFFYPRADTPGCTKEAIDFTRLAGAFAEA